MKVRFNLKDQSQDSTLVFAILRYNGQRLKYSTQTEVPPKYWNPDTQRLKQTKKFPSYPETNEFFDTLSHKILALVKKHHAKGNIPTPDELREELDRTFGRKSIEDAKSFFGYFEAFILAKVEHPDKPIKKSTEVVFRKTLDHLRQFQVKTNWQIVDLAYYHNLLKYFYQKKGLTKNTAGKYIKKLKQVIKAAELEGIEVNPAYKNFTTPRALTYGVYYNLSELAQLERFDFGDKGYLSKARDHFLLQSFIGARYQDYMELGKADIKTIAGQKMISYAPIKANKKKIVSVPLHPTAERVLKKYKGKFPSPITNQKLNSYLKEMARTVGFDQEVKIPSTDGSQPLAFQKWELTTTHTARRNLISNAINSGMPESDVMLMSGHKSLAAFRLYNKTTPEENAKRIASAAFFKPLKVAK